MLHASHPARPRAVGGLPAAARVRGGRRGARGARRVRVARGDGAAAAAPAGRALRRRPAFVLASATVGNPAELAERLTGLAFERCPGRLAARGEAVRPVEPADRRRGDRRAAGRGERGRRSCSAAGDAGDSDDRVRRSRRAAELVAEFARRELPGASSRGSRRTGPATCPRSAASSSAPWPTASCSPSRRRARWSSGSTSGRWTRRSSPATRERARRCGSRPAGRAAGRTGRWRCWWRRTTRSTSTWSRTPTTCSTSRPRPRWSTRRTRTCSARTWRARRASSRWPTTSCSSSASRTPVNAAIDGLVGAGELVRRRGHAPPPRPRVPAPPGRHPAASGARSPSSLEETGELLGTADERRALFTLHTGAVYLHQGEQFEVVRARPRPRRRPGDAQRRRLLHAVARRHRHRDRGRARGLRIGPDAPAFFGAVRVTRQVVELRAQART